MVDSPDFKITYFCYTQLTTHDILQSLSIIKGNSFKNPSSGSVIYSLNKVL